jgi:Helix-turn-helix domain
MTKELPLQNKVKTPRAAEILGKAPSTLVKWRCTKEQDLPYYKSGGTIYYDVRDLINFLESGRVDPSEAR